MKLAWLCYYLIENTGKLEYDKPEILFHEPKQNQYDKVVPIVSQNGELLIMIGSCIRHTLI